MTDWSDSSGILVTMCSSGRSRGGRLEYLRSSCVSRVNAWGVSIGGLYAGFNL